MFVRNKIVYYRYFLNPICSACSLKHLLHINSSYFLISPFLPLHTLQALPPLLFFLGCEFQLSTIYIQPWPLIHKCLILDELLQIMSSTPTLKIEIQGHICCKEVEVEDISIKRAKTVYNFLLSNGITESRISYRGFASSRPIHPLPERNEEERVANRRVEILILEK